MKVATERETDGRWIAEIPDLPGVMTYGKTRKEAVDKVKALALRVMADRLENGEEIPELRDVFGGGPMSHWPSTKANRVLASLLRIGWTIKRQSGGSHKVLSRTGWPDVVFAFHDRDEIGPHMLARIARNTGLTPDDL